MSILIREMEMPKSCYDCYFCRIYDEPNQGYFCIPLFADLHRTDFTKKRIDACPLVEVPPHGRLIDADALEQECQKRLLVCTDQFQRPYEVLRAITLAPTIIPASKEV